MNAIDEILRLRGLLDAERERSTVLKAALVDIRTDGHALRVTATDGDLHAVAEHIEQRADAALAAAEAEHG